MTLIGTAKLSDFASAHPRARKPLEAWKTLVERNAFKHLMDLKRTFNSADYVPPDTVFDVGGNKFRVVTLVNYDAQVALVRHVFTHDEYEAWSERRGR